MLTAKNKLLAPIGLAAGAWGAHKAVQAVTPPNMQVTSASGTPDDAVSGYRWSGGVPINTEMRKMSSASTAAMLAQEYKNIKSATLRLNHPATQLLYVLSKTAEYDGSNLLSGFMKVAEDPDGIKLAEVDLDSLCYWIGDGLFSSAV